MRVSNCSLTKYPWYLQPIFWLQKRKYGVVLDSALVWARIPKLFLSIATLYGILDRKSSPISPELRSLITVRVSQINNCPFCVDINSATLLSRSANTDKLIALNQWHNSDLFSVTEKSVLAYAEAITYSDQQPTDEMVNNLKQIFSEVALIELTGLIAFQNMSSKFNNALDVVPQGFCKIKTIK